MTASFADMGSKGHSSLEEAWVPPTELRMRVKTQAHTCIQRCREPGPNLLLLLMAIRIFREHLKRR